MLRTLTHNYSLHLLYVFWGPENTSMKERFTLCCIGIPEYFGYYSMGITISQYRCAIGCYNVAHARNVQTRKQSARYNDVSSFISYKYRYDVVIYSIIILYMTILIESLLINECIYNNHVTKNIFFRLPLNSLVNYHIQSDMHINLMYTVLLSYIARINIQYNMPIKHFIIKGLNTVKDFVEVSITLYLSGISIVLIIISNCSLLNPGPDSISVYYQNIHGLLAFSTLGKINPILNLTKVIEFQSFVISNNPDIIVLNETWLKTNILSTEIFPNDSYTIFRLDRSTSSHPPDPINPNK